MSRMIDLQSLLLIVSALANVVLAIAGVLALRQLRLGEEALTATKQQLTLAAASLDQASKDMGIRSLREAVTLSAQLCDRFANELLPRYDAYLDKCRVASMDLARCSLRDSNFRRESVEDLDRCERNYSLLKASDETYRAAVEMTNDLEAFSIYFAHGAADEKVAFPAVGQTFCVAVETLAMCIVDSREVHVPAHQSGPYENIATLYKLWTDRIRRADLTEVVARAQSQIVDIPSRTIPPIGLGGGA